MRIHIGCQMTFELPQVTPMIATLNVHSSRVSDLETPDYLITTPSVPIGGYRDSFGNWCNRFVAPAGTFSLSTDTVIRDSGQWDTFDQTAEQVLIQNLPSDTLLFLLGSRYCETDLLLDVAWNLSRTRRWVGGGFRLSATMCTTTSHSATNTRGRRAPPLRH